MKLRLDFLRTHRQGRITVLLIVFGLFVMPFLIYLVGRLTLAPRKRGCPASSRRSTGRC